METIVKSGRQLTLIAAALSATFATQAWGADLPSLGEDSSPWQVDVTYENHTVRRQNVGLAKFRKEHALLTQLFVMDSKTPVAEVVASAAKDAGTGIELKGFVRFQLGEGIEKKQEDFAAEVAAAAGAKKDEPVA